MWNILSFFLRSVQCDATAMAAPLLSVKIGNARLMHLPFTEATCAKCYWKTESIRTRNNMIVVWSTCGLPSKVIPFRCLVCSRAAVCQLITLDARKQRVILALLTAQFDYTDRRQNGTPKYLLPSCGRPQQTNWHVWHRLEHESCSSSNWISKISQFFRSENGFSPEQNGPDTNR